MEKTYCPGIRTQTTRFIQKQHVFLRVEFDKKDKEYLERKSSLQRHIFTRLFPLRTWEIHPGSLTERGIQWPRHFSSCPLLLMCCLHLSHQMCLCEASNTRRTQCWNALEKYIQRLDRAIALSQHSERWVWRQLSNPPLTPLLPHQPPSLFKNAPCLPYIGSCHHR